MSRVTASGPTLGRYSASHTGPRGADSVWSLHHNDIPLSASHEGLCGRIDKQPCVIRLFDSTPPGDLRRYSRRQDLPSCFERGAEQNSARSLASPPRPAASTFLFRTFSVLRLCAFA
jgi:hypothetical protein